MPITAAAIRSTAIYCHAVVIPAGASCCHAAVAIPAAAKCCHAAVAVCCYDIGNRVFMHNAVFGKIAN